MEGSTNSAPGHFPFSFVLIYYLRECVAGTNLLFVRLCCVYCYVLFDASCLLCAACCLLFAVCCLLVVVCC